jgi:hypothetical protein
MIAHGNAMIAHGNTMIAHGNTMIAHGNTMIASKTGMLHGHIYMRSSPVQAYSHVGSTQAYRHFISHSFT